jgi:hypothetical protein
MIIAAFWILFSVVCFASAGAVVVALIRERHPLPGWRATGMAIAIGAALVGAGAVYAAVTVLSAPPRAAYTNGCSRSAMETH